MEVGGLVGSCEEGWCVVCVRDRRRMEVLFLEFGRVLTSGRFCGGFSFFFFIRSFVGRCCGVVVGRRGELWGVVVR